MGCLSKCHENVHCCCIECEIDCNAKCDDLDKYESVEECPWWDGEKKEGTDNEGKKQN